MKNALPFGTLANVKEELQRLAANSGDVANMGSAINALCRAADRSPDGVSADPRIVAKLLAKLNAVQLGVDDKHIANVRYRVRKALRLTGRMIARRQLRLPLSPGWQVLAQPLPDRKSRIALRRLFAIFTVLNIEPSTITAANFADVRQYLGDADTPRVSRVYREMCQQWNRILDLSPAFPQLRIEVPDGRRWFRLPDGVLPASLLADIEAWLAAANKPGPRRPTSADQSDNRVGRLRRRANPLKPRTVRSYRILILNFASMLVLAGAEPTTLTSLAVLLRPSMVDLGLEAYYEHFGNETRPHLCQIARVLCVIARHWAKVSEADLNHLRAWAKDLEPDRYGMTEKNKTVLRKFQDPQVLGRLLSLPARLMSAALAKPELKVRDAVLAQIGLTIQSLINAPVRIDNQASIRIGQHIKRVGKGRDAKVLLVFPAIEVKNNRDLMFELTPETTEILDLYLTRILPRLMRVPSDYLYPGETTGHKTASLLSEQIAAVTEKHLGVRLTAHQFRHLIGYIYLQHNPGDYETVRRLLGHKSIETTMKYYVWMEDEAASRIWNEAIKLKRDELAPLMPKNTGPLGREL